MDIINIVVQKNYFIDEIYSFPVYEPQLSNDVVSNATNKFIEILKDINPNLTDEEIEFFVEEGFAELSPIWISIIWSHT